MRNHLLVAMAAIGALSFGLATMSPAHALSMSECSAKYKAAKDAGTLNGMKWNDFRKAQCGTEATATPAAKPTPAPEPVSNPLKPAPTPTAAKPTAAPAAAPAAAPVASGPAVYPKVVSPKYSAEKAGKQRMHTCRDQYQANKATGGNGGMKWIQKGGGYYSLCNKALKGTG